MIYTTNNTTNKTNSTVNFTEDSENKQSSSSQSNSKESTSSSGEDSGRYCAICGAELNVAEASDDYTQGKVCHSCAVNPYYNYDKEGAKYANNKLVEADYSDNYDSYFEGSDSYSDDYYGYMDY